MNLGLGVREASVTSAWSKVLRSTKGLPVTCPRREGGEAVSGEGQKRLPGGGTIGALGCHLGGHALLLSVWGVGVLQDTYVMHCSRT